MVPGMTGPETAADERLRCRIAAPRRPGPADYADQGFDRGNPALSSETTTGEQPGLACRRLTMTPATETIRIDEIATAGADVVSAERTP